MTIETKYKIGQTIYYMLNNKVESNPIICISISVTLGGKTIYYVVKPQDNTLSLHESNVFASKQEILNSL